MFPPPHYSGEPDEWEDWSWQLKSYVALYKPAAGEVMELAEEAAAPITDQVVLNYKPHWSGCADFGFQSTIALFADTNHRRSGKIDCQIE